jgi:anti-sigma B factor antagonist
MAYGALMQGRLRLDVEPAGDTTTVRVVGEVDLATSPQLRACLLGLDGAVEVDLGEVTFLDSSGLNALIGAKKHLDAGGGTLRLVGSQPQVRAVFDVMGMAEFFELDA